jgi:phosphonopyruvate decarboxylase
VVDIEYFFSSLKKSGVDFFAGVPDSLLKDICAYITDNADADNHIIAANEGNALSLGIGYHLATKKIPLIYLQNSGLGNVINPLLSLADPDVYSIPMLLLIGWRGEPNIKDEPQHLKQGKVTTDLLDSMKIPYEVMSSEMNSKEAEIALKKILKNAHSLKTPSALLVKKGTFNSYELKLERVYERELYREEVIEIIINNLEKDDIVVSTTGVASRELFELREKYSESHEKDFLTVGGMGHASQIALGISLFKKNRMIFCIDGDGALLMHMGSLAINANKASGNFKHIVINNCAHDSVGGQPTVGDKIDITGLAISAGYIWAKKALDKDNLSNLFQEMRGIKGPALLEIQVKKGFRKGLGRPTLSPSENKNSFMEFLDNDSN